MLGLELLRKWLDERLPQARAFSKKRGFTVPVGAWIAQRGHEGLHHICFAVADIDAALAEAQANGATLKECSACKVTGSHIHPEGWVAFLQDEVSGIEIEFMQVYKEGEGGDRPRGV